VYPVASPAKEREGRQHDGLDRGKGMDLHGEVGLEKRGWIEHGLSPWTATVKLDPGWTRTPAGASADT
jgi:hypothetical protein